MTYRSRIKSYRKNNTRRWYVDRISLLKWFLLLLFALIISRLFQLQIIQHDEYSAYARQRMKDKTIDARRGRILLKDGDNDFFELANNVSLELLFADPYLIQSEIKRKSDTLIKDPSRASKIYAPSPSEISRLISPILFEMVKERSTFCDKDELCIRKSLDDTFFSYKRYLQEQEFKRQKDLDPEFEIPVYSIPSEEKLLQEYISDLTLKLSQTERNYVVLKMDVGDEALKQISEFQFPGVGTTTNSVWVNPLLIQNPESIADTLEALLDISSDDLIKLMSPRPNRYVKILNRIDFETSESIRKLGISGLGFYDEHWRNYAEQENIPFAPQLIGFLDNSFNPVYGIEKSMNDILSGKKGFIRGEVDLRGRTLTARSSYIKEATNGTDIVLTIDQVIQNTVEKLLKEQVKKSQARSGQVIVQEPSTGRILAMAVYPGFNPNFPGDAYEKKEIHLTKSEIDSLETVATKDGNRYFFYLNPGYKIEIFKKRGKYFRYKNKEGIGVYRNSAVSDIYEPGSVFKAIVMAAAIDSKEIRPSDIFNDDAPLKVDCHHVGSGENRRKVCDYTIKNSTKKYYGLVTMTQILEKSLNTGMAYISKKLGKSLLYDYLKNFGFGEKTFIELPDENSGKLTHYRNWVSESDMITKAFGQGIAATPIQVLNAISAVINGGLLMEPTLIAGVLDKDGRFIEQEPKIVRRVITKSSSETMKSILISSVKRGVAKPAAIEGYKIGGKTGTSQIATRGLYEKGNGSTIASFGGFAPYEDPRFVILIKLDRPLTSPWGSTNAAPLFKKISTFLLNYLQIPPDDIQK